MSEIDWSRVVDAQARTEQTLAEARSAAARALAEALDRHVQALSGNRPLAECLAWADKERAARALLADRAEEADSHILQAEADQTGETLPTLARKIVEKGHAFRLMSGRLTGVRRSYGRQIAQAASLAEIQALREGFATELARIRA